MIVLRAGRILTLISIFFIVGAKPESLRAQIAQNEFGYIDYVCNKTPFNIVMAVGEWEGRSSRNNFVSDGSSIVKNISGWFSMQPGHCEKAGRSEFPLRAGHEKTFFIHAFTRTFGQPARQYRWTGHSKYLIKEELFRHQKSIPGCVIDGIMREMDDCPKGSRLVSFKEMIRSVESPLNITLENADPFTDEPEMNILPLGEALRQLDLKVESNNELFENNSTASQAPGKLVSDRCLFVWDDPPQPRTEQLLKLTLKWQKLRHCIHLRAFGPVNIEGVANSYVDMCVRKGVNDPKTEGIVTGLIGLGVDVLTAGATGGSATASALVNYANNVRFVTMQCLSNVAQLERFVKDKAEGEFKALITNETHWVDA